MTTTCLFCRISEGVEPAWTVLDEGNVLAFLDHRPLFDGHVLVIPKIHVDDMMDCPPELIAEVFQQARRIGIAVQHALGADGIFVAVNNRVSQSVPHLHVHVVPRRVKDGLRGFMWPRHRYVSDDEAIDIASRIRKELDQSQDGSISRAQ